MNQTEFYQAYKRLLDAGWKPSQIERLCQFHSTYVRTRLDEADLDKRRLEFIRWLVLTGRLSDL